jgi:hypothetical protein
MIDINETLLRSFLQMGRQSEKDGWVFIFPAGVGDSYIVLALLEAFIEHHKISNKINLVIPNRQVSLTLLFPGPYNICSVSGFERLWTHCQMFSPVPMFHPDVPFPVHPAFIADGRAVHLMAKRDFTLVDVYRYILRIPFDTKLKLPSLSEETLYKSEKFAIANGITKGNSIILFPNARTLKSCPSNFWRALVDRLKSHGLKVFSNFVPGSGEEHLEGAMPLDFPLELSIPLCEYAGFTISTLTGTALVNSSAKANKIIISNVDDKSLSSLNNAPNIYEQYNWTMSKQGLPYDGSELFFHEGDDFERAAALVASLIIK